MQGNTGSDLMTSGNRPVKVLYIAGETRSGSTIIGNILDQIDGLFFAGELHNIWRYFLIEHRQCTCGKDAIECEIWQPIIESAFGDFSEDFPIEMERHRVHSNYNRYIPHYQIPILQKRFIASHRPYLDALSSLYKSIHLKTGSEVIVDSSKRPTYGRLIGLIPGLEVYVIHLVRDPRAVTYSWLRKKYQTDGRNYQEFMLQSNIYKSAFLWNVRNLAAEMFWRRDKNRYMLLRYEDFVMNPLTSVTKILKMLGYTNKRLPFESEFTVKLSRNHSVWGNPVRHETGLVQLKLDDEWRIRLGKKNKILVDLLTMPWLYRYNYLQNNN